jgi:flotillin
MKGLAEADAIRARGLAEAEALEKKAEAMEKFGKAAMAEMAFKVLPEVAREIAQPMSNISDVKIYASNGNAVGGVTDAIPVVMANVFDTVKNATGVDLKAIADSNTIDAKVNKNYTVNGEIPVIPVSNEVKVMPL